MLCLLFIDIIMLLVLFVCVFETGWVIVDPAWVLVVPNKFEKMAGHDWMALRGVWIGQVSTLVFDVSFFFSGMYQDRNGTGFSTSSKTQNDICGTERFALRPRTVFKARNGRIHGTARIGMERNGAEVVVTVL